MANTYSPILHKVMAGGGSGGINNANIRLMGNVNHPFQPLGHVNGYVKHFNPHHHHHHS